MSMMLEREIDIVLVCATRMETSLSLSMYGGARRCAGKRFSAIRAAVGQQVVLA